MDAIKKFLNKSQEKKTISVVGDAMIDEYYYVQADRVSPEFPIPVMLSDNCGQPTHVVAGGAGNVCSQFEYFDVDVKFFGMVDEYGSSILGSKARNCVQLPDGINIPIKKRLYHGMFPLCRWDIERSNYGWGDTQAGRIQLKQHQDMLHNKFLQLHNSDVIVLSDYDKGVFSHGGKNRWMNQDLLTIVDPKKGPVEEWQGCYIFKPNVGEAKKLSGITNWKDQCRFFQEILKCKAVVITHGGEGVMGIIDKKFFQYKPHCKVTANSVIGAGDCFCAFLAMGLAHQMNIEEAAEVAYEAGSIYVQRKHNTPVSREELMSLIDPTTSKFCLSNISRDYKLVFTNGCFDMLHEGHLQLLQYAKSLGDKLMVAVNSDESVQKLKGKDRPIIPLQQRTKIIASLQCVDFVVTFDGDTPYDLLKELKPEVLVKGEGSLDTYGAEFASKVIQYPLIEGLSTTHIVNKIKKGYNVS